MTGDVRSVHSPDRPVEHGGEGHPGGVGEQEQPGRPVHAPEGAHGRQDRQQQDQDLGQCPSWLMQAEEQRRPQGVERPKTSGLAHGNALEMG